MISGKFSRLLQALEMRRALALKDIEVAETQALAQAQDAEQRLRGHLEALVRYDRRVRDLLEQLDDRTFLQVAGTQGSRLGRPASLPPAHRLTATVPGAQESQLLAPPAPLGPLTPLKWDEDRQLAGLKESLSRLCGALLEEGDRPRAPAEAADSGKADPTAGGLGGGSELCPPGLPHPTAALTLLCLLRGPRSPGTSPKRTLSTEEEALAE